MEKKRFSFLLFSFLFFFSFVFKIDLFLFRSPPLSRKRKATRLDSFAYTEEFAPEIASFAPEMAESPAFAAPEMADEMADELAPDYYYAATPAPERMADFVVGLLQKKRKEKKRKEKE